MNLPASPWEPRAHTIRAGFYHGLATGPLREAALLLDRLMTGDLLPPDVLDAMCWLAARFLGRSWGAPGYGLGLMSGITSSGHKMMGHIGCGPGSVIAVYHRPEVTPPSTAAAFAFGDDQAQVEETACFRGQSRAKA